MAELNTKIIKPSLAPVVAKTPNDYYYGTRRFSDDSLHLICCCALFSTYDPDLVASSLRGSLSKNNSHESQENNTNLNDERPTKKNSDLADIQGAEVRGCFFQMLDNNHAIYQQWSHENLDAISLTVMNMVQPFIDAGQSHMHVQRWNRGEKIANPIWRRGAQDNAKTAWYFAKSADNLIGR